MASDWLGTVSGQRSHAGKPYPTGHAGYLPDCQDVANLCIHM